ncbi:alanine--tRNA ligase [Candidatus Woesearchaeota archaeon]|nr:alanine--tRNA ligase [Candidatus Woesearchaeota archaeon]MCF7901516.1 alanine--tRNA ligase [Candidatus Woesearchaeota archaeon]MCF8013933.1 alanine--tRNA ligase [Candidatus Woesearchaeota archaeon]
MIPDKQLKKQFKKETSNDPEKYYAVKTLKKEGFERKKCECGTYFYTHNKTRDVCGDPSCSGGFTFLTKKITKKEMTYIETWKEFSKFFNERKYTPIERYTVVARWREDTDFVQASIYDFQPYVVNGSIEPPANPLVVPQFCLRFNDVDNVGITMSHNTGFVMIGQHSFQKKENWNQEKVFKDLLDWFLIGVGIPKDELILHEDAWAGGGNFGPCMEFFSGGVELGNQVYMLYEQSEDGNKELDLKVLDMGMGQERVSWFTQGKGTMYDIAFPPVIKKLREKTKIKYDEEFIKKYIPHAAYLNIDETENVDIEWKKVATKLNISLEELKEQILPLSALYSIAEHSRSLLVAISDGALPSNVKGGYNLRTILRRALSFIDKYEWNINLGELCELHAQYLKPQFPELTKNLEHVKKILSVEKQKYEESKERGKKLVEKAVKKEITTEIMIELYDSHGLNPEEIIKEAKKQGKKIKMPENFYTLVTEKHEQKEQKTQTKKKETIPVKEEWGPTKILYYDHWDYLDFKSKVVGTMDEYIILNETAFYPTSGGQIHDIGTINGKEVIDVIKQGNIVLHKVKDIKLKIGDEVECKIDFNRRQQLAQHHSATHIITGSAKRILGNHVWQAGASKKIESSRLDITHYEQLTDEEIKKIEELANKIVEENRPIYKTFMKRNLAEAKYSTRIYQGGAVPGKELRIVNIEGFDVEACGGTHLDLTGDIGHIKILRTSKIQDGIVRIEFVAGAAAEKEFEKERNIIRESEELLECTKHQIPKRAQELFEKWKKAKKGKLEKFKFETQEKTNGNNGQIIQQTAEILKTQPEHIIKTLKRFKEEINNKIKK